MATHQHLADILDTDPAYQSLAAANDVAGIVAAVNLADRLREDHQLKTARAVILCLGPADASVALTVLQMAGETNGLLAATHVTLCSTGIDFADPMTQAMIDQIYTGDYAYLAAPLKALGVWYESLADQQFAGVTVDTEFVEAAMVLYARRQLERQVTHRYNEVLSQVQIGAVEDWAAARSLLGAE